MNKRAKSSAEGLVVSRGGQTNVLKIRGRIYQRAKASDRSQEGSLSLKLESVGCVEKKVTLNVIVLRENIRELQVLQMLLKRRNIL